MTYHSAPGRVFSMDRDVLDVTSLHRPDEKWVHVDAAGHEHRWLFEIKGVAVGYRPDACAMVHTLKSVKDYTAYFEDGEPYDVCHYECRECGATVNPGFTSDDTKQYIAGLASYRIDGVLVPEAAFRYEFALDEPEIARKIWGSK